MVTRNDMVSYRHEYYGLHDDDKPTTGVPNASVFYEMDTQTLYMFDADSGDWVEQFTFGG